MEKFKKDLLDEKKYSLEEIINKYIIFGTPVIFKEDEKIYYNLKKKIGEFLNVGQRNVFIAGSTKLGFSIAPNKLWQKIDEGEAESDIDVVVISREIFDLYWKEIYDFNEASIKSNNDKKFLEYFFRGWLRLDKWVLDK